MSQRVQMKLPIDRPVVGLRLHSARSRQGEGGAPTRSSNTVQWLLDLKARADAESDAQFAVMRCIGSLVGAVKPIPALVQRPCLSGRPR